MNIKNYIKIFNLLFRGKKIMNDKGLNKTEFIAYLFSIISLTIEMLKNNTQWYSILITILTIVYIICRTIYKLTKSPIDDIIVENLEQLLKEKNLDKDIEKNLKI